MNQFLYKGKIDSSVGSAFTFSSATMSDRLISFLLTKYKGLQILLKKVLYLMTTLAITLLLTFANSTNLTKPSLIQQEIAPTHALLVKIVKSEIGFSVITQVNQAAKFNHDKQLVLDYSEVVLLAIFFVIVVNFKYFKLVKLPLPWYLLFKRRTRNSLTGWKTSNILYKSQIFTHNNLN